MLLHLGAKRTHRASHGRLCMGDIVESRWGPGDAHDQTWRHRSPRHLCTAVVAIRRGRAHARARYIACRSAAGLLPVHRDWVWQPCGGGEIARRGAGRRGDDCDGGKWKCKAIGNSPGSGARHPVPALRFGVDGTPGAQPDPLGAPYLRPRLTQHLDAGMRFSHIRKPNVRIQMHNQMHLPPQHAARRRTHQPQRSRARHATINCH